MSKIQERTKNLYEQIPGCPAPPLISLPQADDIESLVRDLTGTERKSLRFSLFHAILTILGLKQFQENLTEEQLETLLRQTDLRRLGQCAPVVSASVNLADDPRDLSPFDRAVTLIYGARNLYDAIQSGTFSPDMHGEQCLEMGQYPNLFGTSLIWEGKRKPRIFKSRQTSHITVAAGRRLHSLDIGSLEPPDTSFATLKEALCALYVQASKQPLEMNETSLGLLSSATPKTQRKAFQEMGKDPSGFHVLESLRHSFFTICLDLDHHPATDAEAAHIAQSENFSNRWHQSSLQLIVFGNAKACAIFKFDACIDGNTMMRGAAEIQKRAAQFDIPVSQARPTQIKGTSSQELKFKLRKSLNQKAWTDVRSILDNQQATFEITSVGSRFFKEHQVDAVPVFVQALHMAIRHVTGTSARIEQLLTMSKFRCMGLTSVMVSNTAMTRFTEYLRGRDIQKNTAQALLFTAIDTQKQDCRAARSDLPFSQLIPLFLNSLHGWQTLYKGIFAATRIALNIKWSSDVILSHPAIFPEAPMLGRPGVRLPYVNYFGLHYRLMEESITLTMMPSFDWTVSNAEFVTTLEDKLCQIRTLLQKE